MNIFLVEDSPSIRRLLVRRLRQMSGMRVVGEAEGETQALALIRWTQPDMVMMDLSLSEGSGLHLLAELRRSGYRGHVAVLTSQDADTYRRICLDAGADAFYDKASGLETLFNDIADEMPGARSAADNQPTMLLRDGLTGLYNDVALQERLDQSARGAMRDGTHLAVYVLRLEGLKSLSAEVANHLVLKISERLRNACSDADILARRTFSQFCMVLTRVDGVAEVEPFGQRLCDLVCEPIQHGKRQFNVEVELGVALFPEDAMSSGGLLTLAEASAFGAFDITTH
jgi:diguanylate cyclase (GGDEF)-like protein